MTTDSLYTRVAEALLARQRELSSPLRLPVEQELADQHQVGRDTIRRALQVLEKQGAVTRRRGRGTYLQPPAVRVESLTGKVVGFVPPWWADSTSAWFTSRVFDGVSRWADEHEAHLSVLHAERQPDSPAQWLAMLESRRIVGLVWVHPRPEQLSLIQATAPRIPSIVLGRAYPGHGLHHVIPDYDDVVQRIDDHLVEHGHLQYAVVGTSITEGYSQTWIKSLDEAHRRRGTHFSWQQHFIDIKVFDREKLGRLLLEFHQPVHKEISAYVLTSSSYLSPLLADDVFRERIRQDLSIVTWDFGLYPMHTYWPGHTITHVTCDWSRIGHRAMDALAQLASGQAPPEIIKESVGFEPGQTVHRR